MNINEKDNPEKSSGLEPDKTTEIQKKIEAQIAEDEENLVGDELSVALSKDRTNMSEHRTRMSENRTGMSEHRTDLSEERTDLSIDRTMLSYERTMMSWVRTSTSLLTFGFSIYKIFQGIDKLLLDRDDESRLIGAKELGVLLIIMSIVGLIFGLFQNYKAIKNLEKLKGQKIPVSGATVIAFILLLLSIFIFLVVVLKV